MPAEQHPLDNEAVAGLLDILFADRDERDPAPDWAAIESRVYQAQGSLYGVVVDLLRAFHLIYEDEAAAFSALYLRVVREP